MIAPDELSGRSTRPSRPNSFEKWLIGQDGLVDWLDLWMVEGLLLTTR